VRPLGAPGPSALAVAQAAGLPAGLCPRRKLPAREPGFGLGCSVLGVLKTLWNRAETVFALVLVWKAALLLWTGQPIPANDSFFYDGAVVNLLLHGRYCNPALANALPISGHEVFSAYPPLYQLALLGWMKGFGTSALAAMWLHGVLFAIYALLVLATLRAVRAPVAAAHWAGLFLLGITFHDRPDSLAHVLGLTAVYACARMSGSGASAGVPGPVTGWRWLAAASVMLCLGTSLQIGGVYWLLVGSALVLQAGRTARAGQAAVEGQSPMGHEAVPCNGDASLPPAQAMDGMRTPLEGTAVAQTGSLPYRGLPIRNRMKTPTVGRLPVGDTAGCQPALRACGDDDAVVLARRIPGVVRSVAADLGSGLRAAWPVLAVMTLVPVLLVLGVKYLGPHLWAGFQEHARQTPSWTSWRWPTGAEVLKILRSVPGVLVVMSAWLLLALAAKRRRCRTPEASSSTAARQGATGTVADTRQRPAVLVAAVVAAGLVLLAALFFLTANLVLIAAYLQPLIVGLFLASRNGASGSRAAGAPLRTALSLAALLAATRAIGMTTVGVLCARDMGRAEALAAVERALAGSPTNAPVALSAAYLYDAWPQARRLTLRHADWLGPATKERPMPELDALLAVKPARLILTQFDYYRRHAPVLDRLQAVASGVTVRVENLARVRPPDASPRWQRVVQHVAWAPVMVTLDWGR